MTQCSVNGTVSLKLSTFESFHFFYIWMSHLLGSMNAFNDSASAIKTVHAGDTGPLVFLLRTKEAAEGAGEEVATTFLLSQ